MNNLSDIVVWSEVDRLRNKLKRTFYWAKRRDTSCRADDVSLLFFFFCIWFYLQKWIFRCLLDYLWFPRIFIFIWPWVVAIYHGWWHHQLRPGICERLSPERLWLFFWVSPLGPSTNPRKWVTKLNNLGKHGFNLETVIVSIVKPWLQSGNTKTPYEQSEMKGNRNEDQAFCYLRA